MFVCVRVYMWACLCMCVLGIESKDSLPLSYIPQTLFPVLKKQKEVSKPMKRAKAEDLLWDWGAVPGRSLTAAGDTQEAGSNKED